MYTITPMRDIRILHFLTDPLPGAHSLFEFSSEGEMKRIMSVYLYEIYS